MSTLPSEPLRASEEGSSASNGAGAAGTPGAPHAARDPQPSVTGAPPTGPGSSPASEKVAPWLRKLPNQLTWLRILCIPVVVLLMLEGGEIQAGEPFVASPADLLAAGVFGIAALTDFFDGFIARRFGVETVLGKLLDPLADKLLVVSALIILVEKHRLEGWIAVLLIVRDLGINAIRISAMEENILIASSWIGKTKTAFLDVGIVGLAVYGVWGGIPFGLVGKICMWAALVASLVSAAEYLFGYARHLRTS